MSEEKTPDLGGHPDVFRLIADAAPQPVTAFGPIPEGHEGPYNPTPDEILEGVQRANQAAAQLAEASAELVVEELRKRRSGDPEGQR
jgi:hypothetical protein